MKRKTKAGRRDGRTDGRRKERKERKKKEGKKFKDPSNNTYVCFFADVKNQVKCSRKQLHTFEGIQRVLPRRTPVNFVIYNGYTTHEQRWYAGPVRFRCNVKDNRQDKVFQYTGYSVTLLTLPNFNIWFAWWLISLYSLSDI